MGYGGAWFYLGQHDPVTGVTFKRRLQDDIKQTKQVAIGHWGSTVHKRAVVQGTAAVRDTVVVQDTGVARMVVVQGMVVQVVQVVHRAVPGKASRRRHRADRAGLAVEVEAGARSPEIVRGRERWAVEEAPSRIQELGRKDLQTGIVGVSRMEHILGYIPTWWI